MRNIYIGFILCLAVVLSGCITTTNINPVNKEVAHDKRVELGMKYLELDKRDNARRQFSMALKLKAKSALAYHGIALVHIGNGEVEPASIAFEKALKYSGPDDITAIEVSYGEYLLQYGDKDSGDTEKACAYFEKAVMDYDYPGRVNALYLAGQCAFKKGDMVRVKGAYEHIINLNPNYAPVLIDLAEIYFKDEQYAKCRKLLDTYEKMLKPTPKSLWLGIRIERIFGNKRKESGYLSALKSKYPYSNEYLEYKKLLKK